MATPVRDTFEFFQRTELRTAGDGEDEGLAVAVILVGNPEHEIMLNIWDAADTDLSEIRQILNSVAQPEPTTVFGRSE